MMKDLLRSFLPWIFFSVLAGSTQLQLNIAIIIALFSSLTLDFKDLKKGFTLSWGTLVFFSSMFISVVVLQNDWVVNHAWLLSNGGLAFIAYFSLLIRKPFTIQYAKEITQERVWQSPLFYKINFILTLVWALIFTLGLLPHIARMYFPELSPTVHTLLSYLPIIFGVWFTKWFPDWYKTRCIRAISQPDTAFNPFLAENYAPVKNEISSNQLEVIGEIPKELAGIYMRNGPNPYFLPISYTYPFDGDGMLHAIYFENGKARYRNRFVETKSLMKEKQAGKALYGGLLKLLPMDPQFAGPEDQPIAIKNGAFINVIKHADKYLALNEAAAAYEITPDLNTIGEWNPEQQIKAIELCAHTRLDPVTGELWFINYNVIPPFLTIYKLDKTGKELNKWDIDKPACSMIHDFVLTQNYVIIIDTPAILDVDQIIKGGSVLSWQPELGVRICLMSRKDGKIHWLQTDSFFVFHFANAYEHPNEIIIDYVHHNKLSILKNSHADKLPPSLYRISINLQNLTVTNQALDDAIIEFPRIREDKNSLQNQFIYTLSRSNDIPNKFAFNTLIKYDIKNKESTRHHFGKNIEIDEPVFVPALSNKSEDDGYIMLFTYDRHTQQSEFVILDARHILDAPMARIKLPQRVPHGLHGSWIPSS